MSTAFAELPISRRTIDAPINNKEQATLETTRVLFFAHDTITDREKRELPFKEFGGIHLPHLATLRDSHYMLYRCRLTQLPPFKMIGDWDMMLPPAEREGGRWQKSFVQTVVENGQEKQTTINGFLESKITEEGEFKNKRSNHLSFTKRYPLHEARQALKRFGTNTAGGVVEIEALMGASQAEIDEAQYFFFPDWADIARGASLLPATTKGLQAHLKARVEAIKAQPWDGDKKAKFYSIGKDMLRSSTEYHRTASEAIRSDEIAQKMAFTKGDAGATTSVVSEQYLEQTETRRKEDLITGEHSATKELVSEMRADRAEKNELEAKRLLLEERKQYMDAVKDGFMEKDEAEEIRLGLKKAPSLRTEAFDSDGIEHSLTDEEIAENATLLCELEESEPLEKIEPSEGVNTYLTPTPDGGGSFTMPVPQSQGGTPVGSEVGEALLTAAGIDRHIDTEVHLCGAPSATGTCARIPKEGQTRCWQHPE